MNAKEFEEKVGRPPELDDLDRVNCPLVGEIGHQQCGWCDQCDRPKFMCRCPEPRKLVFENGQIVPKLSDLEHWQKYSTPRGERSRDE